MREAEHSMEHPALNPCVLLDAAGNDLLPARSSAAAVAAGRTMGAASRLFCQAKRLAWPQPLDPPAAGMGGGAAPDSPPLVSSGADRKAAADKLMQAGMLLIKLAEAKDTPPVSSALFLCCNMHSCTTVATCRLGHEYFYVTFLVAAAPGCAHRPSVRLPFARVGRAPAAGASDRTLRVHTAAGGRQRSRGAGQCRCGPWQVQR